MYIKKVDMDEGKKSLITNEETADDDTSTGGMKQLTVDEALIRSGSFGRYQLLLFILCTLFINGGFAFQSLITYYVADDSPWSCTNETSYEFCKKGPFREGSDFFTKRCEMDRNEWYYEYPKMYSFSTEFDLVCSKEYLKALSTALFFIGSSIGALLSGPLADTYGRKPVINGALFPSFVASFSGYFVTSVWQYLSLRVIIGISFGALASCVYIYFSENNAPKSRGWVMNIYYVGFTISMLKISLVAYFVREWRKVVLYTSAFPFVAFLASFLIMESPQWLAAKGKMEKAEAVLKKIAGVNKKEVNICLVRNHNDGPSGADKEKKQYSYFHLFNNGKVMVLTAAQSFIWFGIGLVFYSITLESANLGGSLYTNFILSSLADLPGYAIAIFSSLRIGRKKVMFTTFFIIIGFCLALGFTPHDMSTLRVTFALFGRIAATIPFNTLFLWTFEIYPTVIRSQGMNICQLVSRLGCALSPFLTSVLQDINPNLPYFIMAGVAVICGLLSLVLPETINKPTREKYEEFFDDGNNIGVNPPSININDE